MIEEWLKLAIGSQGRSKIPNSSGKPRAHKFAERAPRKACKRGASVQMKTKSSFNLGPASK